MQLQLTIISFKSSHFYNTCLFQVIESKLFAFEICHILDHSSQGIDEIDDVVSFVEHFVNVLASLRKLALDALSDDALHEFWVRLVANFENIGFVDFIEASGSRLKIV